MKPKHREGAPCSRCGGTLYYKTRGQCVSCTIKRATTSAKKALAEDPEYRNKRKVYLKRYRAMVRLAKWMCNELLKKKVEPCPRCGGTVFSRNRKCVACREERKKAYHQLYYLTVTKPKRQRTREC